MFPLFWVSGKVTILQMNLRLATFLAHKSFAWHFQEDQRRNFSIECLKEGSLFIVIENGTLECEYTQFINMKYGIM